MSINQITAFRTSDGKVHEDETTATAHEFELQKAQLAGAFMKHGPGAEYTSRSQAMAQRMFNDLWDWMTENDITLPWAPDYVPEVAEKTK